jgi:glycerol-3-phosphate cytidylyltransferase
MRGFTCGAFDLLHAGHALMLEECRKYCDYLIVGLQVDPSIDRSDKNKPVQSLDERLVMIKAIRWVDEVIQYTTEQDLYDLLKELYQTNRVDLRIVGADWAGKKFTGHELPLDVIFNSRDHGYSTSELRRRVYEAEAKGACVGR